MANPGNGEPQLGPFKAAELRLGAPGAPKGWYSRGYVPHCDAPGLVQSITFRLADALPQSKLAELEQELRITPPERVDARRRRMIETWLDAGMGCCALRHPALALLVQETLLKWDGERYRLIAWCIMANHMHALIEPWTTLSKIVQSWKSFTGRWALARNTELQLCIPGNTFWMRDY
jgi:putative transposase